MVSLAKKLDSLTIKDDDERKNIFGYFSRVKKAKTYFLCKAGFIVIPNFEDKRYLLCKMIRTETEPCYLCFACENPKCL